jgi:phosphoribosylaminoimidazolecarboxamide formyltransferase/IMP cyclohydrolase
VKSFDTPACVIVKHANRAASHSGRTAGGVQQGVPDRSDPRRSAASSPSTVPWMAPAPRRWPNSSSKVLDGARLFGPRHCRCSPARPTSGLLKIALPPGGSRDWDNGPQPDGHQARRLRPADADGRQPRIDPCELKVVTRKQPSQQELQDLLFAWKWRST